MKRTLDGFAPYLVVSLGLGLVLLITYYASMVAASEERLTIDTPCHSPGKNTTTFTKNVAPTESGKKNTFGTRSGSIQKSSPGPFTRFQAT